MWNDAKRQRFEHLRQSLAVLTKAEKAEMDALNAEIEHAESEYLADATEAASRQRQAIESQNRALEALIERKKALADRLATVIAEARTERSIIDLELAAVLADNHSSNGNE